MDGRQSFGGKQDIKAQTIGIRADANETIAAGHVMRCIAIAAQLVRLGAKVIFYTADENADALLEAAGMTHVCLHTDWRRMEDETPILIRELQKAGCGKLLVDSYQATERYFQELAGRCRLICMDDCFAEVYPADMVINYNPYCARFPYAETYGGRTRLLLGAGYAPLREEFAKAAEGCADKPSDDTAEGHILLSSGGGDPCGVLPDILAAVLADGCLCGLPCDVVVGGLNGNREKLERLAAGHPNVRLHCQVKHMAELMRECTAAVSAAGTTLLELCAMRVPTVFFCTADNQQYDHEFFGAEERMLYAGDVREDRQECLARICGGLRQIVESRELQDAMRQKLRAVTDGKGAYRIAEEIVRL